MNKFKYIKVDNIGTAVESIARIETARFIAGGTNLTDLMKEGVMKPSHVIDISRIALKTIEENEEGGLRLGALVTNADTAYNELVEKRYPLLSKAILAGASPQLRNMATDGGNLLQRTRCYYFYDTAAPCNKREPETGCSAINGFNRLHAILGHSEHCIATYPSDMAVALAALEAKVNVTGLRGSRVIPILDFHRLPGNTPHIDNNLQHDEIITSIDLPSKGFNQNYAYLKLRNRASYAFALVSVAAALELEGDIIKDVRLALGGVAHKPWRKPEAEKNLTGKTVSRENFKVLADQLLEGAKGFKYNEFKIELAKRAIVRALEMALASTTTSIL